MSCCAHCRDAGDFFSYKTAKNDLRRYLRRGPNKSTRLLLKAIRSAGINAGTLLDIGGGVGVIQLELFKHGLQHATNVEASSPFQMVSREEAKRQGVLDRTAYYFGDAVELEPQLPVTDIVTLDRVICCYPDVEKLIYASARKAARIFGAVYPRNRSGTRIAFWLGNLWFRLRGSDFRIYLRPSRQVDTLVRNLGFRRNSYERTFLWHVVTYIPETIPSPGT